MPELPDVENYRRILHRSLRRVIRRIEVLDPEVLRNSSVSILHRALDGKAFTGDERRGKWLIARVDCLRLLFHFGMTGRLDWVEAGAEVGRFVRFRVEFVDGSLVYRDQRRLRGIWLCRDEAAVGDATGVLGPDARGITFPDFEYQLSIRRGAVKAALMDQSVIAGLGNMLSDEILWRAHVHPRSMFSSLESARRHELHRSLRIAIEASVKAGAIPRTKHWLNGQRGLAKPSCPIGHGALRRSKVAGRTTLWCPLCQPDAAAGAATAVR